MDERCFLSGAAGGQAPGPQQLHILDIVFVDLIKRAIAPAIVSAAPHQPVAVRRIFQHFVGDRSNLAQQISRRRLRHCGSCYERQ